MPPTADHAPLIAGLREALPRARRHGARIMVEVADRAEADTVLAAFPDLDDRARLDLVDRAGRVFHGTDPGIRLRPKDSV